MKRILAFALTLALLTLSLAGVALAADDPSEEVTIRWMLDGSNVTDDSAVLEAVNAYLKEKINAKLEVIWGTWGDFDNNSVLNINSGADIDIYFTCSWSANEYSAYAKKGAWVRLDDPANNLLEKYAPNLFTVLPPVLAEGAKVEGADGVGVYGLPGYKEVAQQYTWDINTPLLTELGYSVDDVSDFYAFGDILAKAKEAKGADFYPLNIEGAVLERMVNHSDIVDTNLLLSFEFDPVNPAQSEAVIKSRYETDGYKKFVEKVREYYQAGYINPDMANHESSGPARTNAQLSGAYLIGTQTYAPGYDRQASQERGFEVTFKPAQAGIISTTSARGAMMAISSASKHPERALQFLALLNTDPYLFTLLAYGVEGVHYNLQDGKVAFTDKRQDYLPWRNGLGNITQLPLTVDDDPDIWEKFAKFNDAQGVPLLGFAFDATPVETEMTALINAANEYADPLNAGVVDPAEKLPEFIAKLKANGIDKVLEEANTQLQAFLAAKGN
ncbi:MAG: ABC transporter substrate-binding protein [Oscillospiraceae bacterium]|jgi:putative aldouronate transport system substrate-binding protein|nr:ABC transporter substrate-binding protein [Oscillospiraceae bacterium]